MVSTYAPHDRVESISIAASAALTLVVLIFCELTPKVIAATHTEKVTRTFLWPMRFAIRVLSPAAGLAAWVAKALVRALRISPGASPFAPALTEDEIRAIIADSTAATIAEQKKEMLANIFAIGATQVRTVMIPRIEVTAVEISEPIEKVLSVVSRTNYSRIPVYRGNFENIVGILNVKDLLQHMQRPGEINLQVLLRPVHFIPDTARLEAVLRQLQSMHLHMAIVVDEFGGVEGIVTLEDLLEEIVGEIRDEHDTEVESVRELGPDLFSVAGNLPVKDFNRLFDFKLPESRDYTTVVGFLEARTGRLLHEGEIIRYHDLTFSIEKTKGFQVVSVRVRVPAARREDKPLSSPESAQRQPQP